MADAAKTVKDPIDEIAGGFRAAQVLLTANRLGVFAALEDRTLSAGELAKAVDAEPRALRILCDALAALSLLEKDGNAYCNSPVALEFLIPTGKRCKAGILNHTARLYAVWGRLFEVVKTGKPVDDTDIGMDFQFDERSFAMAMADVAKASVAETADALDLSNAKKMLDIGGGPGFYSIEFAHRNTGLHAVVFDKEETTKVAQANIEAAGLAERVTVKPGDAWQDDFGDGYDFILLSNIIHSYSFDDNQKLVAKCAAALQPGGQLCVKDFILDSSRTSPAWSALFAVNMLVNTERGDCYTSDEVKNWFTNAGLTFTQEQNVCTTSGLLLAVK